MHDTLTHEGEALLFANPPPAFVLWYKPSTGRGSWEPVHHGESERECIHAVGCGGRRGGKWCILPHGKEP